MQARVVSLSKAVVRAIVLAVLAVLSLVGNFAAIIAIIRDRHRTSLCTMILHLSIADLFVSFFCLGGEALWTYSVGWKLGNIACKVFKYWQVSEGSMELRLGDQKKASQ